MAIKTKANQLIPVCLVLVFIMMLTACAKKAAVAAGPSPTVTLPNFSITAGGITTSGIQYSISNPGNGVMVITGTNGSSSNTNYQMVQITVNDNISSTSSWTLNTSVNSSPAPYSNGNIGQFTSGQSPSLTYNTNSSCTGTINFTKVDMTAKQISASFSFNAAQYGSQNTSTITVSGSFSNVGFQ